MLPRRDVAPTGRLLHSLGGTARRRCGIPFLGSPLACCCLLTTPHCPCTALICIETSFLIVVWASLQFLWNQLENPTMVAALKRLFACVPIAAAAVFTWAVVSTIMANASLLPCHICHGLLLALLHTPYFQLQEPKTGRSIAGQ